MNTFDLEKVGSKFCDTILYPYMGWDVVERIRDKNRQETMGDVIISYNENHYCIDEKTASYCHADMVIELIQDLETFNIGWFFKLKKCDGIIYIYFNKEREIEIVYSVKFQQLKQYIFKITKKEKVHTGITNKNFGCTLNIYYPWQTLIDTNIARIIWRKKYEVVQT